jgi:hypothetical protein
MQYTRLPTQFLEINLGYQNSMGSQKVPGIVALNCNGRTYGKAYLIVFKVGPLRAHTLAPSMLPLLEASAEGFFWNLQEFGTRVRFNVLHGCETCSTEAHYRIRERPKSHLGRDPVNAVVGWWQKLLHDKRSVTRCGVMMQKPLSLPAPFLRKTRTRNDQ